MHQLRGGCRAGDGMPPTLPGSSLAREPGKAECMSHRGGFFGKPLHAISRFRHQDAQTPPSPLVGEGGRGLRGDRASGRPNSPFSPCGRRGPGGCGAKARRNAQNHSSLPRNPPLRGGMWSGSAAGVGQGAIVMLVSSVGAACAVLVRGDCGAHQRRAAPPWQHRKR